MFSSFECPGIIKRQERIINDPRSLPGRSQDLVEALASLRGAAGGSPLNANQRSAVLRLLQHLAAPAGSASLLWRSPGDLTYLQQARAKRALLVLSADGR